MSYNSKYTGAEVEALLDAVNGKQDAIEDLDTIRAGASKGATALQSVPSEYVTESELTNKGYATTSALDNKVDKVSGKQLSTEDFTSALKTKLEGLNNYDDTELSEAVSTLRGDFDKLVSGDTSTAIESFNEIMAFLDGIKDTQDLAGIIAAIEQQIAGKMDNVTLATVATSGNYDDLTNKPTIPSAVTESTVSGWGFTKNTGTYSKPSGGIPKTDLASAVQTSLGKADTAVATQIQGNLRFADYTDGMISSGRVIYALPDSVSENSTEDDVIATANTLKTINGQSLVGSGDIPIEGGSGGVTPYITDFTVLNLRSAAYNEEGYRFQFDNEALEEALRNRVPVYVPIDQDAAYEGYGVLQGYAEDLLYFTVTTYAESFSVEVTRSYNVIDSTNITHKGFLLTNESGVCKQQVGDIVVAETNGLYDGNTVYALPTSANGDEDDILVSERNLKTINGQSLIGEGDINISGGGSSSGRKEVVFWDFVSDETVTSMRPNVVYWFIGIDNVIIDSFEDAASEIESYDVFTAILELGTTTDASISLTLPDYVRWANGAIPEIEADVPQYELSISRISDGWGSPTYRAVLTPFKIVE